MQTFILFNSTKYKDKDGKESVPYLTCGLVNIDGSISHIPCKLKLNSGTLPALGSRFQGNILIGVYRSDKGESVSHLVDIIGK